MNCYPRKSPGRLTSVLLSGWPVFLVVMLVLLSGLMVGSISSSKIDAVTAQDLNAYIQDFIQKVDGVHFDSARIARNAMIYNAIMVIAIYVLGLTVIGMPVTLAILFVRCFVVGYAVGFLTRDMSWGGVLLTLASILPHNLLYFPALYIGASASVMFSVLLLKRNFNTSVRVLPGLLKYTAIMAGVLVVVLGAGLVEGYVTPAFTKLAAQFILTGQGTQ